MTDDRTLERAARSWLESGPTQAPDRAVDAALFRIQTIRQERDLRIPWRFPTMNPISRIATIAAVLALAAGVVLFTMRPAARIGPSVSPTPSAAPSSIEGTWDVSYTRPEMLAAGISDPGEDNDGNYGHFLLTFQSGWWKINQISPRQSVGGTSTYTVDAGVAHLFSPLDNVTFDLPYTVTATTLTFGQVGPVGFRVKPWTRVATEVIRATPEPKDIAVYRQARNAVCSQLLQSSMPPDADPVNNPAGALSVLQAVIARANNEITRLSALTVPSSIDAEHQASIQTIRDTLVLLQQEVDLINQGKANQVAAIDLETEPLSAQFQQFEQKYLLGACP